MTTCGLRIETEHALPNWFLDDYKEEVDGSFDRGGAPKPRLVSGVKGCNIKEDFFFGEPGPADGELRFHKDESEFRSSELNPQYRLRGAPLRRKRGAPPSFPRQTILPIQRASGYNGGEYRLHRTECLFLKYE